MEEDEEYETKSFSKTSLWMSRNVSFAMEFECCREESQCRSSFEALD